MPEPETARCLHCSEPITGKYCANCGKKAASERINMRFLLSKLLHSADLDRGFAASIKYLLTNPGTTIREFITGQRTGLTNPIKLFLILGTVATWLTFYYEIFMVPGDAPILPLLDPDQVVGYTKYSTKYFSFFSLTAIPIFSLFSWLLFFKSGYNFVENLILNFYIAAAQFIIVLFFIPLILWEKEWVMGIYAFVNVAYNFWVLMCFFQARKAKSLILVFLAVALPQILVFYYNYFLYRLAPTTFWEYLDRVLG